MKNLAAKIVVILIVLAIAFGALLLFGVVSFQPRFDNLTGAWEYVGITGGEHVTCIIDIHTKEKAVDLVLEEGAIIPLASYKQVRYHKNEETMGDYSKICFNTGATIGNSYYTRDSFVFYPYGETVMYVDAPLEMESLVPDGYYRKCDVKIENSELEKAFDYRLDGLVDMNEKLTSVEDFYLENFVIDDFDALIGDYTYCNSLGNTKTASFKKTAVGYTFTIGGNEYSITEGMILLSSYAGIACDKVDICEFTNDHLTVIVDSSGSRDYIYYMVKNK